MLASLLAALVISGFGPTLGAGSETATRGPVAGPASGLTPGELAGSRVVTGFSGKSPTSELRSMVRTGKVAGVILFAANLGSDAEAGALIGKLQAIRRPRSTRDLPLLVMVDQEGGLVKRLPGPPELSAEQMGAAGIAESRRQGRRTGRYLRGLGVNVDLAPVLDVGRPGGEIESTDRSFGGAAGRVETTGGAFAAALGRNRVVPTAKHFPGLGAAFANTDSVQQTIKLPADKLRAVDERPFREFAADGGRRRMVMMSSAIYSSLDPRLPAGLSRRIASDELRGRIGFEGVSITDSMSSAAIGAVGDSQATARLAGRAGVDLLLYTTTAQAETGYDALRLRLRSGAIAGGWFKASVRRVLFLRESIGTGL